MLDRRAAPYGLRGMRDDWSHFCRVQGMTGFWGRVWVLFNTPSLLGLWVYRYGRWAYSWNAPVVNRAARIGYQLLYLWGQHVCKVALDVNAEIGPEVWLAPTGVILVGHYCRVGRGSFLHGHNTLGLLSGDAGMPRLGDRVHVGPGALLLGPITLPDDTVIGPNSVVVRSIEKAGGYVGAPAKPYPGPAQALAPSWKRA
ncbi:MAG TPA: hypothetical protein VGM37_05720 [Armatimonadota bacterium]|jgi:serine O-acetyltransferase